MLNDPLDLPASLVALRERALEVLGAA